MSRIAASKTPTGPQHGLKRDRRPLLEELQFRANGGELGLHLRSDGSEVVPSLDLGGCELRPRGSEIGLGLGLERRDLGPDGHEFGLHCAFEALEVGPRRQATLDRLGKDLGLPLRLLDGAMGPLPKGAGECRDAEGDGGHRPEPSMGRVDATGAPGCPRRSYTRSKVR